jgi:hypothetical protein
MLFFNTRKHACALQREIKKLVVPEAQVSSRWYGDNVLQKSASFTVFIERSAVRVAATASSALSSRQPGHSLHVMFDVRYEFGFHFSLTKQTIQRNQKTHAIFVVWFLAI